MAVTNQELFNIFLANPNMSDAQIVSLMETRGISPEQISSTFGIPVSEVVSRVAVTVPPGSSVTLGDTRVTPQYQTTGSGMDQQVGGIENIYLEKTTGDVNYKAPVGSDVQVLSPTGELVNTIKTKEDLSFTGGIVDALKDPVVLAALAAVTAGSSGLFSGAPAATAAELAQANMALGGVGGTAGAAELSAALATGAPTVATTSLTGGSGLITGVNAGITAESVAAKLAADAVATGATGLLAPAVTSTIPAATIPAATTAASTLTPAATAASTIPAATAAALTPTAASVLTPAAVSALSPTATSIASSLIPTAVKSLFTPTNIGNLVQTGATTAAGLLQQQTSREAAQKAQQMIDAETAAAKASSQFRPIGMTTRFGTSQFAVDPVTGQLTSAGYTLSPEAKNAQDRLVKLAESGLQQAEGAQKAFAPLQTGAESLFKLGQGYLAQNPETVASDYMKSQLALLAPGREQQYAFLQNQLQQQGRGGLSVAQGTGLAPTSPELAAFMNAKIQEDARLAANAQQFGQQNVLFGAGLLGQGSQAMGQYYGGQQAAYSPYTTALGQVQNLESMAQQPFQMGAQLGQTAATAGARAGALGLEGANISQRLATGAAATTNPYSTALSGATANPLFGQVVGGLFGSQPATSGFSYGQYGTGIDPSTGEYFGSLYF